MKAILNHVAILVESIEAVLERDQFKALPSGEIEEFPAEGTRELYIGLNNQLGKLLLMQPNGPGPYQSAMLKRGPGLHHIAIDVLSVVDFVNELSGSGWLLHPKSIELFQKINQVWLCRPGIPLLVEVNQTSSLTEEEYLIEAAKIPVSSEQFTRALHCDRLGTFEEMVLTITGREYKLSDFL